MAQFSNEQGLRQLDNTNWAASFDSGTPVMGAAGNGTFGSVQAGALEASNTADLTAQLVKMIKAQRNYQANAQVISNDNQQIERASCRERVCQYVSISVVAVSLTKQNITNQ